MRSILSPRGRLRTDDMGYTFSRPTSKRGWERTKQGPRVSVAQARGTQHGSASILLDTFSRNRAPLRAKSADNATFVEPRAPLSRRRLLEHFTSRSTRPARDTTQF
jgi:hypothetical protein